MSVSEISSQAPQGRVDVLLQSVREGLAENLRRGLRVGGQDSEQGSSNQTQQEPMDFKQEAFAKACGKSRATISSVLAGNERANPDLSTLCALAATLNISPAFLLMTKDDWSRIIQSVSTLIGVSKSDNNELQGKLMKLFEGYKDGSDPIVSQANLGFDVANQLGLYEAEAEVGNNDDKEAKKSIEHASAIIAQDLKEKKRSFYVAAAMANPVNKMAFQVAVIFGVVAIPNYKPER